MLQYVLTGLAGIVIGIVGLRAWQGRGDDGESPAPVASDTSAPPALSRKLLLGAAAMALAAIGVMMFRSGGDEAGGSQPGALSPAAGGGQNLGDVDTMIAGLAARLEKDPSDGEGFRMLGWSYMMTGRPEKALDPYSQALRLLPRNPLVHSGYGEALVGVAKGKVTPEAREEFLKALALDRSEPRARYFDALWLAQNGQPAKALDQWIELANSGPADAPWQDELRRRISETAAKLGTDVSSRLKPRKAGSSAATPPAGPDAGQMAAAAQLPPDQRQASIEQMVEGLATKLKAKPDNPDGWAMLLHSRMVLKQPEQAARDLTAARKALAGNAAGLARVNTAASEAGVPGA